MKARFGVIGIVVVLALSACGGGSSKTSSGSGGLDSNTTVPNTENAACKDATLTSPEIGVTDKTITVSVVADVDNGFRPGLFKGSWNGTKAWAAYVNANGGLACRQVVVKTRDSKLSPDEAKAAVAAACGDSLALVGDTMLFFSDVTQLNTCKDKAGKATGIPEMADLQTEPVQQCSKNSFATLPTGSACPYSGSGPRTYTVGQTQYDYYFNKYGKDLHGVFAIPKDTPSTITSSMPIFRAENKMGIKSDAEFGVSGTATQPAYTPLIQAIKSHDSNYARNGLDYAGTVLERKEAAAQGVNDQVKVWDCSVQCYDKRLITEGGAAVENQYVWLNLLPLEDKGSNAMIDAFLKYDKEPDGFGMQAFVAGLAFQKAVESAIAANNNDPNAITRTNVLTGLNNLHDFDAGGMTPQLDIGGRKGSVCLVGMQVQNGKFVRVSPTEPGKFDCGGDKPPVTLTIDAAKEYKG
jgi:ABC-type branched-subunit amino acid transport system substrate-binding protein